MPIYEFVCDKCHHEFEELVSGNDVPPCPKCGATQTRKLMSCPCGYRSGDGGACEMPPSSSGSKCSGCAGGNCASCH